MMVSQKYLFRVVVACAVCLALPPVASVQADPDADNLEVTSYRLAEPGLAKYAAATRALATVLAGNPQDCDEGGDESLSAMAARLDAIPGAPAALAGAGIGSREYTVFGLAVFQAGMGSWALVEGQGELPPGVSPENVAFYQAHEAEIQELSGLLPRDGCAEDGEYDGEEGEWDEADEGDYDE